MNLYAVDVSASMPRQSFCDFIEGIKPLFSDDDLIIAFDMEVLEVFTSETFGGLTPSITGGGTDTQCILNFITDRNIDPSNTIILSDGLLFNNIEIPNAIYLIIPSGIEPDIHHSQMIHMHDSWIVPLAMLMN